MQERRDNGFTAVGAVQDFFAPAHTLRRAHAHICTASVRKAKQVSDW